MIDTDPRMSEELYRALFETSLDAVLVFDDAGTYVDVNESYCRLLQLPREALIGRHFSEVIPPDLLVAARQSLGQLMSAGSLAVEFPLRAADGTLVPLEWRSRANIVPGLHVCVARDITERKAAETALQSAYEELQISEEELRVQNEELLQIRHTADAERQRYLDLFTFAPDAYVVTDLAGIIREANLAAERLLGSPRDLLLDTPLSRFFLAGFHTETRAQIRALASQEAPAQWEMRLGPADEPRDAAVTVAAVRDRGGSSTGLRWLIRDVTGRKRAEAELRKARDEAEAANRAKDQFLATLSHELRTPLSPVLLLASTLAGDAGVPAGVRRQLDVIQRNVELEARLIDDLLDLTRIARGKLDLRMEVTDARKVLEHTIEIACERETASGRLRVVTELAAEDHRLWADPSRLTQVLWNLLNNAVKFTPVDGTVTVRSWSEPDRLVLQVSDTGVGIDPDLLPHIFEAFEQGRIRSPRRTGGLGLGLAIGRAIAEMHGGTLTAASEGRGRGATFTLSLPRGRELPAAAEAPREIENPKSRSQNLKILLVEDHEDTAEAMADLLTLSGHRVITADSVSQALSEARSNDGFDLVISDLGLPDGSGIDLMRELSARHGLRGIALSGYGMEEDVRQSLEAGFARHLTKPVSLPQLQAAIRQVAGAEE
jgi:PAS domain S-box-containing protein